MLPYNFSDHQLLFLYGLVDFLQCKFTPLSRYIYETPFTCIARRLSNPAAKHSTVRLLSVCKYLFCATLNFFSRGSFDSVIFLKRASVLPLCFDLPAVCVYVGSKSAKRRTIKQPPPT